MEPDVRGERGGRIPELKEKLRERLHPFGLGWPNVISGFRVALIPVVVALLLRRTDDALWAAFGVFAVGAATDFVDGYLARRHAMKTPTGAWLDPLSDKLFVSVPAVVLAYQARFPWWAAAVIVAREVAVAVLRWRLDARGGVSMPASWTAKLKTVSQLSAVGVAIAPLPASFDGSELALAALAVALTVYSGAEYFLTTRYRVEAG